MEDFILHLLFVPIRSLLWDARVYLVKPVETDLNEKWKKEERKWKKRIWKPLFPRKKPGRR